MHKFKVYEKIIQLFYNAVIESMWSYCICSWGGNACKSDIRQLTSCPKQAGRVIGDFQKSFEVKYKEVVVKKLSKTLKDDSHPLHSIFKSATNERSGRMRLPYAKTNRHRLSFVPQAIKFYNADFCR